jgi:hypothetical protein
MNYCSTYPDSRKIDKQRMARVVAVFLNSILNQKLINQTEIFSDMQQFCIDHSTVKECKILI